MDACSLISLKNISFTLNLLIYHFTGQGLKNRFCAGPYTVVTAPVVYGQTVALLAEISGHHDFCILGALVFRNTTLNILIFIKQGCLVSHALAMT